MTKPLAFIIEDESDLSYIFSEALKEAGFATEIIASGDRALERLEAVTPDVVILDLHLPKVDGRQILQRIRANSRLDKTRIVIASADPSMADMVDKDADLVLIKPISFGQLRDLAMRVRASLDRTP
ncbi:MAG: response regulator transcription factor [Anaerolineae bacterium]|nr:response regulator transcription factor [Anaerolineae bacterium]